MDNYSSEEMYFFHIELNVLFFFVGGRSRFRELVDLRGMGDECDKGELHEIPKN